eukprot:gene1347-1701_t
MATTMEVQAKLFVTVIQAQNLRINQEKSNVAAEIVGAFFDPFSSPILQSIEKIQNFSSTHLTPIFTVPGSLIGGVVGGVAGIVTSGVEGISNAITGNNSNNNSNNNNAPITPTQSLANEKTGVVCKILMDDQEFKTSTSTDVTEPKWNQSYSFNVCNPCAELSFSVSLTSEDGAEFVIGRSRMNLIEEAFLWEQKPAAKWINLTKRYTNQNGQEEDEVVGRVELQFQYKYRKVWDSIYCGKMLLIEKKYQEALTQFEESIQRYPTTAQLYSMMVDCHLGLKQYVKAIEHSMSFIKYDRGYEGYLKVAMVFMESGQLEKAQQFIDKARDAVQSPTDGEKVKYQQLLLSHQVEVDKINKLLEQGYEEFKNNEFTVAVGTFTKAIAINNYSPILYELRALCNVGAKLYPAAIEDNNKIIEIDHNWPKKDQVMSGYVHKDGQINVMSKKRWFTLKSVFLYYYIEQNEMLPQGIICLHDFYCAPKQGQKVKFQLSTKDRSYYLKVDSPDDFDKWVTLLIKISKTKLKLPPIKEAQDSVVWKTNFLKKEQQKSFMLPEVLMLPEQLFVESGRFAFSIGDKIKSKLTSINQSDCQLTGWCYKMGQLNKEWQRRYFMLSGTNLYYAKIKESEEKNLQITPTGLLPLDNPKIDPSPSSTNKANAFEVITNLRRKFVVATDTSEEKDRWMKAIAIAAGIIPVAEEAPVENLPSSESLMSSRSRRIKSLRAPPVIIQEPVKPVEPVAPRKITTSDISSSESKYFSKFNLPATVGVPQQPIVSKAPPLSQSSGGLSGSPPNSNQNSMNNLNNINNSNNNNGSQTPSPKLNSSSSSTPNVPQSPPPSLRKSTVFNSNNNNNKTPTPSSPEIEPLSSILGDDDDDYPGGKRNKGGREKVGLLSGKHKSINDDTASTDDGDDKRCCKCSIQ